MVISNGFYITELPCPFGELNCNLSESELEETAYEIFVATCRASNGRPLSYVPSSSSSSSSSASGPSLQRSLTLNAANNVKKVLGMRSSMKKMAVSKEGTVYSSSKYYQKKMTLGEIVRIQMRVSEQTDARIRRALLRITSDQLGRGIESMVLPLELLQQFKSSDFADKHEYEAWQMRTLKILEAGLLGHPHFPLEKSDSSYQRLRQIIQDVSRKPLESGKYSESMQVLRTAVMSLACRSFDGSVSEECHWADNFPLNVRLYLKLLEACFDTNKHTSTIEEIDDVLDLLKKTWIVLGMNQMLHDLCFTWVLFYHFVATGQVESDLLITAEKHLADVAKDAKETKDPMYCKILSSTAGSILGWIEKRLLAYHDIFHLGNIDSMQSLVSLSVLAAEILVEEISHDKYYMKRKGEADVAHDRVDNYIRSSLCSAFVQRMEKAELIKNSSKNQPNALPVLSILAKDINELANNEKEIFSPVLKRWHPLATGVAVATLHACYRKELKQFILGLTELTPDALQVLNAANKLEKDLVLLAVEDSVDSADGGKALICEMPPFEAEAAITNMVKEWIRTRVDLLKAWVERNLQQEVWDPRANRQRFAPSAVDVLRIIDETLDAFFELAIPNLPALLPDLMNGMDRCIMHYIFMANSGCGSRNTYIPTMPALTRCTVGSKFHNSWKKKDKFQVAQKRKSQVDGDSLFGIPQLCVRINTFQHLYTESEKLEKKVIANLRNDDNIVIGFGKKFELSPAACLEGIQQLSEVMAYKVTFCNLSHVFWDGLYVGEPSSTRIEPVLKELEHNLEIVSETANDKVYIQVITEIMKASFEGFLLVLLSGGPSRAFSQRDSQIIEDDFRYLKDLFWSNGDGLPDDLIDKHSRRFRDILCLFQTDTQSLIDHFRHLMLETYGNSAKSKLPLPPTSAEWDPTEPNTILRVLCHRNDEEATKFLRKTYNLPKKL